ncbi:hypothetical protein R5R35_009070 [Gryllus longicercus]|uniref:Cytochrome P450 n=1 Tax=Gryllus longicercus TaxID=2509291 RepID=A0AAN9ZDR3_9ORTH
MASTWLLVAAALVALLYWHLTRTFSYWHKKGVYYLPPTVFFGNLKERILFRISFHEFQLNLYNKFQGHKVAGFFEGRRPALMIRDPQLIRDVMVRHFEHFTNRPTLRTRTKPYVEKMLINLEGQHWKHVRTILTPTFSTGKLRAMEVLVQISGDQLREFLYNTVPENKPVELEMKELFGRFTMDVIASCAFGVQCNSLKQPDAEFASTAARFNDISLAKRILLFLVLFLVPPFFFKYITLSFFNNEVMDFLASVVQDTRKTREKLINERRNDFLQLMIDAAQKESETSTENVLDEDTITAQALLILLAGFETSSTLLAFASYELAINPEIQAKAREEVNSVLNQHKGSCTYEALQDMNYLENVLLEALRKHPPVARVDRICTAEYTFDIDGKKITVDPKYSVSIPVIGLHYDPQYFPDPQRFDPERFSQENRLKRSPYVFLPFGEGPRNCIGKRFALLSTKIAMVHLLKDFKIEPCDKTNIPYKYSKFSMLLKAQDGIFLNIERLNAKPTY